MSVISELLSQEVNQICADCSSPKVSNLSIKFGIFICNDCAKIHKDIFSDKLEALPCDSLGKDVLSEVEGNAANEKLEAFLPHFYSKPTPETLHWIKEYFIHCKYVRQLFAIAEVCEKSSLGTGKKTGQMHKKGKCKEAWKPRTFVLKDGTLKYFINHNDEQPKSTMDIQNIEIRFEEIDNSLVLAITHKYKADRTYYVLSSTARETVEWYYSITAAKKGDNSGNMHLGSSTLSTHMYKPGPGSHDKWKRRWFSLSNNYITYFNEKLDSHPKGHIEIGSSSEGYHMKEDLVQHGKAPPTEFSFTLVTPSREFKFCAESKSDQLAWMKAIKNLISTE